MTLSTLAITLGDPAGVGPEITLRALASPLLPPDTSLIVVGDSSVLEAAAGAAGFSGGIVSVRAPREAAPGAVCVLDQKLIAPGEFTMGEVNARCGRAAYGYIVKAIALAKEGAVDGVVTNAINKEALRAAGIPFPGHTEIFAHETGTAEYSMMFLLEGVAVAHVTTHCSVRQAIELVTCERVTLNIRLLHRALLDLGIARPRIAVGGLNPHAGEHGLFGDEEPRHIEPAVKQARAEGIEASGPYPPDSVFMRAFKGEFDGVVSMLHDHGFVALKSRNFDEGVNITVGLPIVRTSVGHGTAFDIAGKGIASPASLLAAIDAAHRLVLHRKKGGRGALPQEHARRAPDEASEP